MCAESGFLTTTDLQASLGNRGVLKVPLRLAGLSVLCLGLAVALKKSAASAWTRGPLKDPYTELQEHYSFLLNQVGPAPPPGDWEPHGRMAADAPGCRVPTRVTCKSLQSPVGPALRGGAGWPEGWRWREEGNGCTVGGEKVADGSAQCFFPSLSHLTDEFAIQLPMFTNTKEHFVMNLLATTTRQTRLFGGLLKGLALTPA